MRTGLTLLLIVSLKSISFAQGRVVVNEYMSWSGCNTTSEFIELLNFGPGPMNISCFIVTNGLYSVTIPTNTILKPGEYYVLSGRDVLTVGCGNTDSAVTVDLNWTTCNCTNKPVPTTGSGFLQDGGGANEKIVLLDAAGKVLDAVSRTNPTASDLITSSAVNGACTPLVFDLDLMGVAYESIGIATGVDNSYSRRVDGDCGWVKTTAISAGATNKTGSTSSASYSFTTLDASQCNGATGSISISVGAPDLNALFPMTYLLAFDINSNNIFEDTDIYTSGSDNSAPSIDINNLAYGRYRITVGSSSGCNLQSFDFFIFNCYGLILPYRVINFKQDVSRDNNRWFRISVAGLDSLKSIVLEAGSGTGFRPVNSFSPADFVDGGSNMIWAPPSNDVQYRIRLISISDADYYSGTLQIAEEHMKQARISPNPAVATTYISLVSRTAGACQLKITNTLGQTMLSRKFILSPGKNVLPVNTSQLTPGTYHVTVEGQSLTERITLKFQKSY